MASDPRKTTAAKLGLLSSLYLSQGLPYGFFTQALPVMMRQRGRSLPEVSLSYLLLLPWALKFLWGPLVDAHGARRSWILGLQAASCLALLWQATVDPARGLVPVMAGFLLMNFLSATQDVPTDALAVDLLDEGERGLGNGVQVAAYRVGMIAGGGPLLVLLARIGWRAAFLAMAALLFLCTGPVALLRERRGARPPGGAGSYRSAMRSFAARPGAGGWLLVVFLFKAGEAMASGMIRTFLVDRGLTLEDIGWMLGTLGSALGLFGALLGGYLAGRLGRLNALALFALLQALSVAGYGLAARLPKSLPAYYALCGLEHLCSGLATAALFTAMMDVSRPETGATDYTVQACVVVVASGLCATLSGFSARALGYPGHFALCTLLCLLAFAAVLRHGRAWERLRAG